ncbi:hypothetical protein PR048_025008 [Dryococelus australis]|uniref:MADF domain-containing protein n=1 Tax=Dryococelus australis TaxID=614101 RepID=A0ABQ9GQ66_9NEOP|nr:hypothetical protein PR048_025008 [Dryococelus australis]
MITFIELFRERPVLWDKTRPEFKDENKKNDAWIEIGEEMQINKAEVQAKLRNLTSHFYRGSKKAKSGSGADSQRKWVAFEHL